MAGLSALALAPAELGDISTLLPAEWKSKILIAAGVSAFILRVINGVVAKDAETTPNTQPSTTPVTPKTP